MESGLKKKERKKKLGHCPRRIRQGLLCAAPEWTEVGERDRKTGAQVDGQVVSTGVRYPLLLINRQSRKTSDLCSAAVFDYIDTWQEII